MRQEATYARAQHRAPDTVQELAAQACREASTWSTHDMPRRKAADAGTLLSFVGGDAADVSG